MKPIYTYVYPYKAGDEAEAPQMRGQRTAVRPPGYVTRDGGFRGLGMFWNLPIAGYGLYYACKNGYLNGEACQTIGITPGKTMPGSCPDDYRLDGSCVCPVGAETPDGGCAYPDGPTVDASGALPIGGSPPVAASATIDPLWIGVGIAAVAGAYFLSKK